MSKKISRKSIDDLITEYLNQVRKLDKDFLYINVTQVNEYETYLVRVLTDKNLKQLFVRLYLNKDDENLKQIIREELLQIPDIDMSKIDLLIKFVIFIISQIDENIKPYPFQIIELKTEEQRRNIKNNFLTEEQHRNIKNNFLTEDDIDKLKVFNLLIKEFENQKN
jgi:hypothetical protein